MDVFETGTTGTAFERSWTPAGGWSAWKNLGGTLSGGLAAVYDPASHDHAGLRARDQRDIYVNSETPLASGRAGRTWAASPATSN